MADRRDAEDEGEVVGGERGEEDVLLAPVLLPVRRADQRRQPNLRDLLKGVERRGVSTRMLPIYRNPNPGMIPKEPHRMEKKKHGMHKPK